MSKKRISSKLGQEKKAEIRKALNKFDATDPKAWDDFAHTVSVAIAGALAEHERTEVVESIGSCNQGGAGSYG